MRLLKWIFIFSITIVLASCTKKTGKSVEPDNNGNEPLTPTACYTPSKHFIQIGDSITFQNCSINYDRVEWNFGDGSTSTLVSPVHVFKTKGLHEVSLVTYNGDKTMKLLDTVACGMKASVTMSFSFSHWEVPADYTSLVFATDVHCYLCKDLDTTKIILVLPHFTGTVNDSKSYTVTVPLADENTKYQVRTNVTSTYMIISPGVDAYRTFDFGNAFTDGITIYGSPKPKGSKKLTYVTMDYSISNVSFN